MTIQINFKKKYVFHFHHKIVTKPEKWYPCLWLHFKINVHGMTFETFTLFSQTLKHQLLLNDFEIKKEDINKKEEIDDCNLFEMV